MPDTALETPAPKVVCKSKDCGKEYASRGGMMDHYKKKHNTGGEIQSPLGRFPPATNPARVLFNDDPATQGNSHGDVNSPKVVSEATYVCDVCEVHAISKEVLTKHKQDEHSSDKVEEEYLGEALDDVEATDLGVVAREVERMAFMYKQAEINCHNCSMSKEVEVDKERLLQDKDSRIESMKIRQVKTDEKKNKLYKEKKKVLIENVELKKELKKCQELLSKCQKKVTTMTAETATRMK